VSVGVTTAVSDGVAVVVRDGVGEGAGVSWASAPIANQAISSQAVNKTATNRMRIFVSPLHEIALSAEKNTMMFVSLYHTQKSGLDLSQSIIRRGEGHIRTPTVREGRTCSPFTVHSPQFTIHNSQ
jgi:hypothetical protein